MGDRWEKEGEVGRVPTSDFPPCPPSSRDCGASKSEERAGLSGSGGLWRPFARRAALPAPARVFRPPARRIPDARRAPDFGQ